MLLRTHVLCKKVNAKFNQQHPCIDLISRHLNLKWNKLEKKSPTQIKDV